MPNHASRYASTIVFVVRKDNPRGINGWPDLLQQDVEIVTPDPRAFGNGEPVALAASAALVIHGRSEAGACASRYALYQHLPAYDQGARGASIRFALMKSGDVQLTSEDEALREVAGPRDGPQIVDPLVSILAEPCVAWLDAAAIRDGVTAGAKADLSFLFSDEAQKTTARLRYRTFHPEAAREACVTFPQVQMICATAITPDWGEANDKFFGENGIIESILSGQPP